MNTKPKYPIWGKNFFLISTGIWALIGILPLFEPAIRVEANLSETNLEEISQKLGEELILLQENSLLPVSNPTGSGNLVKGRIKVVITAYSSSPWETDESPFITAAGTSVRDGIIANNYLPIGTKIRIPELYGNKIFTVEDRMNWKKGNHQIDIWFPTYWEAKNFGAKRTYIEILEG